MQRQEGKYDDLAALVRVKAQAQTVLLVVLDGSRGSGTAVRVRGKDLSEQEQAEIVTAMVQQLLARVRGD
jgi:hypothetical protein